MISDNHLKIIRFCSLTFVLFLLFTASPRVTLAAEPENCTIDNIQASACKDRALIPTSNICGNPRECITWFVNVLFLIAVVISFLFIVWAGIDYITAGGADPGPARTKLTNAVVGLVIVIIAWALSNFVLKFFHVNTEIPVGTSTQNSTGGGSNTGGNNTR